VMAEELARVVVVITRLWTTTLSAIINENKIDEAEIIAMSRSSSFHNQSLVLEDNVYLQDIYSVRSCGQSLWTNFTIPSSKL
jgi:hypothetical protein